MSLFRSSLRGPAPIADEAIERYLAVIRTDLAPDPLFRRRLRGHVLNRFVAAREGIVVRRGPAASEMGRLGRGVLYASFAFSLSVTSVMAASQHAIPGDAFYPLKRQIESLRLQVVPDHFHDELAAYALGDRIAELQRLADNGDWAAVATHAGAVHDAYATVLDTGATGEAVEDRLSVAMALLDRLPDQARSVVSEVLRDLPGVGPGNDAGTPGQGRTDPPDRGSSPGNADPEPPDSPRATPGPSPAPRESGNPRTEPDHTPRPAVTPRPSHAPRPMPPRPMHTSSPTKSPGPVRDANESAPRP